MSSPHHQHATEEEEEQEEDEAAADERARQEEIQVRKEQSGLAERMTKKDDLQQVRSVEFDKLQKDLTGAAYVNRLNTTQAAGRDASLMTQMTSYLVPQVKSIGLSNSRVTSTLLSRALRQQQEGGAEIDFAELGKQLRVFFPSLPTWDCMLGPAAAPPALKKVKSVASPAANAAAATAVGPRSAKKKPEDLHVMQTLGTMSQSKRAKTKGSDEDDDDNDDDDEEEDEERVMRDQAEADQFKHHSALQKCLNDLVKQHKQPNLLATVVNPQSFTQTVENIFALSFLVKDGLVEMREGSEKVNPTVVHLTHKPTDPEKTFVMAFSYDDWRRQQGDGEELLLPNRTGKLYHGSS